LKPFSCTKSMMKGLCQLATTETWVTTRV
jgi:hypothetical protein